MKPAPRADATRTAASAGPRDASPAGGAGTPAGGAQTRSREWIALPLFAVWWVIAAGWWALAFVGVTPATPAWLARTQYVCFGNLPSGLPDAYGWLRLLLAPLGLLVPLLVVHGGGLRNWLRQGWRAGGSRRAWRVGALGVLMALTLGEGLWVGQRVAAGLALDAARAALPRAAMPFPATYPRLDRPAPAFSLVAQHGQPLTLAALRGQVVYLTFAFGHCNGTCPLTVRSMLLAAQDDQELGARVVIVTLDPWRDRPSALATLARQWELEPVGGYVLSGSVAQVLDVLARYEIPSQRDPNNGDIAHPPLVYVIDRAGRIAYLLNNPGPAWIAAAGRRAASG